MRRCLSLPFFLLFTVSAHADGATPQDRAAVTACIELVQQNQQNAGGDATGPTVASGPAGQLDSAAHDAGLTLESCIGAVATPCQQTPDGESNLGMAQCFDRETAVWDERLNANYQSRLGDATGEYRDALKKMQRAWIAYRDAKCGSIQPEFDGSMAIPMTASCLLTETARQAIFLEPE